MYRDKYGLFTFTRVIGSYVILYVALGLRLSIVLRGRNLAPVPSYQPYQNTRYLILITLVVVRHRN